ncbi:MAG: PocR ligand-binding domain-containing protein [Eubacteriales bacterium]
MTPYIYSIIPKDKLEEMLTAFEACTELPIHIIDEHGSTIMSKGETIQFCQEFQRHLPLGETCEKIHIGASEKAISLGETYIFACHANLHHIVFPLINRNALLGSVLVGPFLMDEPDSLLILDIAKHYNIPTASLLELYETSNQIAIVQPPKVTQISRLLYFLLSNLVTDSRDQFIANQLKLSQQSKISNSIQMYKTSGYLEESSYPYEKEKSLITKVKTGNVPEANGILNDLLGYVLFSEGSSLETVKARSIELCSLLSRASIEGGSPTNKILVLNNMFLKSLININNLDELCMKLQECVETFSESMFLQSPTKNNDVIQKAAAYIAKNFSSPITLDEVANYVHLNPAYFSTTFKQSTGSSFKEHLNMVRIEESKRLLANTDYSIIDIATATGFVDQSYFSKVFKRYTGLTPKQYR